MRRVGANPSTDLDEHLAGKRADGQAAEIDRLHLRFEVVHPRERGGVLPIREVHEVQVLLQRLAALEGQPERHDPAVGLASSSGAARSAVLIASAASVRPSRPASAKPPQYTGKFSRVWGM